MEGSKRAAVMYSSMLLAAVIIPASAMATERLYDQLFPGVDVPEDIKIQIEENLNSEAIEMPLPPNQEKVSRVAANLLQEIKKTSDPVAKKQLQSEFNRMMPDMLKADVVPRHLYEQNPEMWDSLLEEFMQEADSTTTGMSHQSYDRNAAIYHGWLGTYAA